MCCRQLSGQAVPTWWRRATATSSTTCRPTRRCMRTSRVMTAIISTPAAPSSTFSTAPASAGAPVYLSAHLVWSLSKWHYFYSVNLQHLLLTRRSQHSQKCQKAQNPRRTVFVSHGLDLWHFDPKINGFSAFQDLWWKEHFYAKFDDFSCIGFLRYRPDKNRQTNRRRWKPSPPRDSRWHG